MKKTIQQIGFDLETLKMWKYSSVKAKINWLDSALKFGKAFERPELTQKKQRNK